MRALLPLLLVLPLVAACGRGFSDTHGDGGTLHPGTDAGGDDDTDAGDDTDGGRCLGDDNLDCPSPCGDSWVSPTCIDGQWICPTYGACPLPVPDGGSCAGEPPIACGGISPCPGVSWEPVCSANGQWTCELNGVCEDGGIFDGDIPDVWVPPPDANPPPYFSCGDLACNADTSYCQIDTGGAVAPDGGVRSGYQCTPLPSSCDKGVVDCACVQAFQGGGCGCVNAGNEVIVTCEVP